MEYIRKIYQERRADFRHEHGDTIGRLYIPALRVGESEVELRIDAGQEGGVRRAEFTFELFDDQAQGDRYILKSSRPWTILKQAWSQDHYETISRGDIVGQEEAAYEIERMLLNTMVEPPITSLREEQDFWQIAIATSVEVFEVQGVEIAQYFENVESANVHRCMELGFHAIWQAAHSGGQTDEGSWMGEATGEDVARYCWRRMQNRLS